MSKKFKKFIAIFLAIILSWPLTSLGLILSGPNIALAAETDVVINEFLADPTGTDTTSNEWIELYNNGNTPVSLDGWTIVDVGDPTTIYTFSPSDTIGGNGWLSTTPPLSNKMDNTGENTLELRHASGSVINSAFYRGTTEGFSYARKPDGTGAFVLDSSPTQDTVNNTPPPTPTLTSPTTGTATTDNTPDFSWTSGGADPDGDTVSYRIVVDGAIDTVVSATSFTPSTAIPDGQYQWRVAGYDGYETGVFSANNTLIIDTTAPTSTITTPTLDAVLGPNTWPALGQITGTATDNLSGIAAVSLLIRRHSDGLYWNGTDWIPGETWFPPTSGTTSWSYDLAQSNLTGGVTYTIQTKALNGAGNEGLFVSSTFTWDVTAPSAPDLSLATTPVNADTYNIQGSASDNLPGTVTIKIYSGTTVVATGSASTFSIPVTLTQNATNTFTVTATDTAGNESAAAAISIVEDSTFPEINITSPSDGSTTADNTPEVWYTVSGGTVTDVTIDGASLGALAIGTQLSALSDGSHTLAVQAEDTAGNITIKYSSFTVDTTAPTPGTTTNPDGATVGPEGIVVFEGDTEAEAGVTLEIFSAIVTKTTTADSSGHWRIEVALSEIGEGEHTAYVTVEDTLGNKNRTQIATFTVAAKSLAEKLKEALGLEAAEAAEEIAAKPTKLEPEKAEAKEEGAIKAEEAAKAARNWTGVITTLAILVIAAGVGTAGFYGYEWWTGGRARAPVAPRPRQRGRPKGRGKGNGPPRTRW